MLRTALKRKFDHGHPCGRIHVISRTDEREAIVRAAEILEQVVVILPGDHENACGKGYIIDKTAAEPEAKPSGARPSSIISQDDYTEFVESVATIVRAWHLLSPEEREIPMPYPADPEQLTRIQKAAKLVRERLARPEPDPTPTIRRDLPLADGVLLSGLPEDQPLWGECDGVPVDQAVPQYYRFADGVLQTQVGEMDWEVTNRPRFSTRASCQAWINAKREGAS